MAGLKSWIGCPPSSGAATAAAALEALLQGVHQVDHLAGILGLFGGDHRLALLLARDQVAQGILVAILELGRIELGLLLLYDLAGDLEHGAVWLGHVAVEDLARIADLVIAAQRGEQDAGVARLERTDAL